MNFRVTTLIAAIVLGQSAIAESDREALAAEHFAAALYEKVANLALEDLIDRGLSESYIDFIVDEAVRRSAMCHMQALDVFPEDVRDRIIELLADGEDLSKVLEVISDALGAHANPAGAQQLRKSQVDDCMAVVNQDLGISIN